MDETQASLMPTPAPQPFRATLRRGFHALAQGSLGLAGLFILLRRMRCLCTVYLRTAAKRWMPK